MTRATLEHVVHGSHSGNFCRRLFLGSHSDDSFYWLLHSIRSGDFCNWFIQQTFVVDPFSVDFCWRLLLVSRSGDIYSRFIQATSADNFSLALIRMTPSADFCSRFIQATFAVDSFRQLLRVSDSGDIYSRFILGDFCRQLFLGSHSDDSSCWLLQLIHSGDVCRRLLRGSHSGDFSFVLIQKTPFAEFCSRFIQAISTIDLFRRLLQLIHSGDFCRWLLRDSHSSDIHSRFIQTASAYMNFNVICNHVTPQKKFIRDGEMLQKRQKTSEAVLPKPTNFLKKVIYKSPNTCTTIAFERPKLELIFWNRGCVVKKYCSHFILFKHFKQKWPRHIFTGCSTEYSRSCLQKSSLKVMSDCYLQKLLSKIVCVVIWMSPLQKLGELITDRNQLNKFTTEVDRKSWNKSPAEVI